MTPYRHEPNLALDRSICRYWDGSLNESELAEFNRLLIRDPMARAWFAEWADHAAAASVQLGHIPMPVPGSSQQPYRKPPMSRRQLLSTFGIGAALGIVGGVFLPRNSYVPEVAAASVEPIRVVRKQGDVVVRDRSGVELPDSRELPAGGSIQTVGESSNATLALSGESTLCLCPETVLVRADHGTKLMLTRGGFIGDFHPPMTDHSLIVGSSNVSILHTGRTEILLSHSETSSELSVLRGTAAMIAFPTIGPVIATAGEMVTLRSAQAYETQPIPLIPDQCQWQLDRPTPGITWPVGLVKYSHGRGCISPVRTKDKHRAADVMQLRSNHAYTRGMVRIFPDSVIECDYRLDRPGSVEMTWCTRAIPSTRRVSGHLNWQGNLPANEPGAWRTLRLLGRDLVNHDNGPTHGAPWVGFLLIFNTGDADLGLCVSRLRVSRPGPARG